MVAGFAAPLISDITLGGVSLQLRLAEKVRYWPTDLLRTWLFSTRDLLRWLKRPDVSAPEVGDALQQFTRIRSYEALNWIGPRRAGP